MKRQTYTATMEITEGAVATVDKFAHNSAMRAGVDLLRGHARGGYWHQESVTKSPGETIVDYRHDDGRQARVTVTKPTA